MAEERLASALEKALGSIYHRVVPKLKDDLLAAGAPLRAQAKSLADDEVFWYEQRTDFFKTLGKEQEQLLKQGVTQGSRLGMNVNWELANQEVLRFAEIYNDEWWNQLSKTTRQGLRSAIQTNIASGAGHRALVKEITPLFGRKRAKLIASTETTRLYAEGNMIAYRADPTVEAVEWMTVGDDRVCEECAALDAQEFDKNLSFDNPPLHPACRCWLAPIAKGEAREAPPKTMADDAEGIVKEAKAAEKNITKEMDRLVRGRGKLEGREFRLKSHKSMTRKMDDLVKEGMKRADVAADINDAVRYTMVFEDAEYAKNAQAVLSDLRAMGYETKVSNYWSKVARKKAGGYQGINVVVTSPTGQRFELQFHTRLSLKLKEEAHPLYQHLRRSEKLAGAPTGSVRATLEDQMAAIYDQVPIPQGATGVPSSVLKPIELPLPADFPPEPTHVVPLDPVKMADDVAENMLKNRSSYLESVNEVLTGKPLAELQAPYSTMPLRSQAARAQLKERVMIRLAERTGIPEVEVREWIANWAASSSDKNPRSLMLQKAAEDRFGIQMNAWMKNAYNEQVALGRGTALLPAEPSIMTPAMQAQADAIIDAMYLETQEWLASHGIERMTLMRGMEVKEEVVRGVTRAGGAVDFHANPLSSWSIDPETAAQFSGKTFVPIPGTRSVISVADFEAGQIVAMPLTGAGCANEWEFIVLGGRQQVFMIDITAQRAAVRGGPTIKAAWWDDLKTAIREALLDLTGRPVPVEWGI